MKKLMALMLSLIFTTGILCGCKSEKAGTLDTEKINIVCTVFPAYDWINEIVGDKADKFSVTLLGSGGDLHSFQPTAKDISLIYTCDLFIGVGGSTEQWIDEIKATDSKKIIKMFDFLSEEDFVLTSDDTVHHNHDHNHDISEYDEHIWLSLRLAEKLVNGISDELCRLDFTNSGTYQANAASYCKKLKALDGEYQAVANASKDRIVVFADRFPFAYMMRDYDITTYAAFPGCSSDSDADFKVVTRLLEKVKSEDKSTVLVLENSNESVVAAINSSLTNRQVKAAVMNSCQITGSGSADGSDYIEIMKNNLEGLKVALK